MYAWIVSLILLLFAPQTAVPASYESLRQRAETSYAEKSFARAHELYKQAALLELSGAERRWVDFRVADTKWRSDRSADASALQKLIENSGDKHDRVWAEAHESLGDFITSRNYYSSANNPDYLQALDWWSGSDDIPLARSRYLALVFKMIAPQYEGTQENYNGAPREVLVNALKIATSSGDLARLRFILASQLLSEQRPESIERALELLDSIIRDQKSTAWYDDALFAEANQLASGGDVVMVDGEPRIKPDYERALALYRRIVSEFPRGTTRYFDQAQDAISEIITPQLTVNTTGNFLPDSEQEVMLSWRNAGPIECSISRIDLTSDLQMKGFKGDLASIASGSGQSIRTWTVQPKDNGLYFPGSDRVRISPRLDAGAYLVSVRTTGASGKTILLVSDINIVTHSLGLSDEIYVSDVHRGAPIAGARIHVADQTHEAVATTDANGLAHVDLHAGNNYRQLLITAAAGNRQAWMSTYNYAYWIGSEGAMQWRVYAFTDRPAYRPDETVHWKALVRARNNDGPWVTPAKQSLDYVITDPRGQKVATGTAALNEYGSYWADLKLTPQMPLGPYTLRFLGKNGELLGFAQLFTLEEYKLPEYTVNVSIPNQYRLGDTVEAVVDAQYYFGGPVANATVEVSVDRSSYSPWWGVIDWYTSRDSRGYYPGGGNQNVFKQTLQTDENGRALVHFDTQVDAGDSSYTINACATDASRREVCGSGSVNVMRQRYTVHAQSQHSIGTPGQKISVDFKAADSKEQPVKTTGKVHVTRRKWEPCKNALPYCGQYREEDVLTSNVTTNDEGIGTFTFTPEHEGYYQLEWSSEDRTPGKPLRARDIVKTLTSLWITRNTSTEIGYHAGGLELIVDRDTLRSGDRVPLIVATENSDRWVMLTISGTSILETRLVHLDGTLKVVEVPIDQRHVPDFMVTASSVFNRMFYTQTKSLKVPPVDRALTVEVKSDQSDYKPHANGTVTITTRDYEGHPVAAEVALSVSDESVTAIAQDPAGDPRQLFYGESRVRPVTVNAGVQMQRFVRLVEGKDGTLVDENAARREKELDALKKDEVAGYMDMNARDGQPRPQAVAEAITVTAASAEFGRPAPPPPPPSPAPKSRANGGEERQQIEVVVRNDFRSTAFWKPDIVTDANGIATATFEYPEALTEWRATARVATVDSRFGMASSKTHTRLPLIVRLEGPRFFVAGDRAVVSAVMNNNTDKPMTVTPSLEATGITVTSEAAKSVDVPPHGEARAEWTIAADQQGTAKLRVTGRSASEADAMEKSFTVYEHGIDKLVARSGKVRGSEAVIQLPLPGARRDTSLVVNVSPSLASAMLDALPYLIDYPYGCTEQTMSRFLPASIVARAAAKQNLPRPAWLGKLDEVTSQSVRRLYDFQHGDGGWGWWKDDSSQTFMTAYVIWGFAVAKEGEVAVDQNRVDRAAQWLDEQLVKSENDANGEAWMLHALAAWRLVNHQKITGLEAKAFDRAFAQREQLSAYSRALLALAAHDFGDTPRAQILIRNLENGVKMDRSPDRSVLVGNAGAPSAPETMATAHWGADRFWWHWYEGPVESTAFSLQALVEIDPDNKLVEPVMNWLVKNRRGARWNNTRDTAIALLALTDYLRASGELSGDTAYELSVNGKVIGRKSEAGHFTIDRELVRDANEITIRRTSGKAPLYFSVEGRFVSLEEPVTAAGHELFVKREYLRLVPKPTLLKGVVYDKVPMADGATIASGDRVEVVVTIETKNDYDYLLFEDLKPAGFEATSVNSGGISATNKENGYAWIYQELRDRKVAMFASHLDQGIWTIRYQLRAETPGSFHALPLMGEAMYVPEVRANGEETHVVVK